jgi:hypothetical protein
VTGLTSPAADADGTPSPAARARDRAVLARWEELDPERQAGVRSQLRAHPDPRVVHALAAAVEPALVRAGPHFVWRRDQAGQWTQSAVSDTYDFMSAYAKLARETDAESGVRSEYRVLPEGETPGTDGAR